MSKLWLVSDMHFGHDSVYNKFIDRATGDFMRPWAKNSADGDEIIRATWNDRVGEKDKVLCLGDVAIPRRGLKCMAGLKGRKVLIRGNHDIFKLRDYAEYFEDVLGELKVHDTILSHRPMHPDSIPLWCRGTIHGHTHSNMVLMPDGVTLDRRYENVCIEHTDRGPIEWEAVRARFPAKEDQHAAKTLA
jgi:calcineurin-like phosphoesterase family protein